MYFVAFLTEQLLNSNVLVLLIIREFYFKQLNQLNYYLMMSSKAPTCFAATTQNQ